VPRLSYHNARYHNARRRLCETRVMKTIGFLGGMSWESTAEYYRLANELVRDRLGGLHSADCLIRSVDFAAVEAMQVAGEWEEAGRLLAAEAAALEAAGAQLIVLCTNTMHAVAPAIEASIAVPLVHIADTTAEAVLAAGCERVGLLATGFTMEQPFYIERLAQRGVTAIVPGAADRAVVHRIIYEELCLGVIRDESRAEYRRIMASLVAQGVQGIIFGCTEIELLVSADDTTVPTFPTTRLHVEAAVRLALAVAD
jgi:aspartate racemase